MPDHRAFLPCFIWILIFCDSSLLAEDWPGWRGSKRDGHSPPSARIPAALPADPKVVWKIEVGEGFASPVVAGGKVFYFDNVDGKETLHAIHAADHQEIWRTTIDSTFQDDQGPPGPRCTPLVDGDRVYAQSGKGALKCLRVNDGKTLWGVNFVDDFGASFLGEDSKVPGAAEHGYTATPVIEDNLLIACVGGTNGAGIVAFDKISGRVVWKSQDDLASYAAPVIGTLAGVRQVVCFTVSGLIGLEVKDGKLLWRVPHKSSYGRNVTTPVLAGDWVVVGSYQNGSIGVKISRTKTGQLAEQAWINKAAAMNFSSPIVFGRHVYGLGPARNIICLELETGKIVWSRDGYFSTSPGGAHAAFLGVGKNILMATDGGQLILFPADPAEFRETSQTQVCGLNWCNPAYADGRLYIRDGIKAKGKLYCVELAESAP